MPRTLTIRRSRDFAAQAEEAARLLEALANPRRLMILCELADGERAVGELVSVVGLQQAALSQHLARLREQGLVKTRRESQKIFYRLASPAAVAVINTLAEIFCSPDQRKPRSRS